MLLFAFGGAGGLINASYNINLVVHNTSWVSGHFHLTVGTAVTLTFFGISYWLIPYISGRALWSNRVALVQAWTWLIGMTLFSHYMHVLGLLGMPRRTPIGQAPYIQDAWKTYLPIVGVGGVILTISALLFFFNIAMTAFASRREPEQSIPWAKAISGPDDTPAFLDTWTPYVIATFVLIALAYGPVILSQVLSSPFNIPGMRPW